MFRLILQTQARLGGFFVLSHHLSPKVKSTLLITNDLQCAVLLQCMATASLQWCSGHALCIKYKVQSLRME